MPTAAVPSYLGKDFSTSSPGLRFGLYLSIWDNDWKKTKEIPRESWKAMTRLNKADKDCMKNLCLRQKQIAKAFRQEELFALDAITIAPFTTGLGNEHPLENGFAFLNPYGLPYLAGSGVKGVLRQAARELADGEWGDNLGWHDAAITNLFGRKSSPGDTKHLRGALTFWDVIPEIKDDSLQVEIMTPHQRHYYQQKNDRKSGGSTSPHDSGQPNPISFLTVPPGSGFAFHVLCDLKLLNRTAPELTELDDWKKLLSAAFTHAFDWCGFGAKTAVGYGAMGEDKRKKTERLEEEKARQEELLRQRERIDREGTIAQMDPIDQEIARFLDARADKNQPEINALLSGLKSNVWSDEKVTEISKKLKVKMQTEKKWKEKSEKKNPEKDRDYVNTQTVMKYLSMAGE
jgi:CRISPR-associated protein Cmr6